MPFTLSEKFAAEPQTYTVTPEYALMRMQCERRHCFNEFDHNGRACPHVVSPRIRAWCERALSRGVSDTVYSALHRCCPHRRMSARTGHWAMIVREYSANNRDDRANRMSVHSGVKWARH